jgi:hypothetical protein
MRTGSGRKRGIGAGPQDVSGVAVAMQPQKANSTSLGVIYAASPRGICSICYCFCSEWLVFWRFVPLCGRGWRVTQVAQIGQRWVKNWF